MKAEIVAGGTAARERGGNGAAVVVDGDISINRTVDFNVGSAGARARGSGSQGDQ